MVESALLCSMVSGSLGASSFNSGSSRSFNILHVPWFSTSMINYNMLLLYVTIVSSIGINYSDGRYLEPNVLLIKYVDMFQPKY